MTKEQIKKIYEELKAQYDFLLPPSEQLNFWAEFGMRIFMNSIYEDIKKEQEKVTSTNMEPLKPYM